MTAAALFFAWTPPYWLVGVLNLGLWIVGFFLIVVILLQSGKGGGLAGAFGGAGGQSAFGSRMGDEFTKITLYIALVWFLMLMLVIKLAPASMKGNDSAVQIGAPGAPEIPGNGPGGALDDGSDANKTPPT